MTAADLHDVVREGLWLAVALAALLLLAALLSGVLTGLFQSFTRLADPTVQQVARIAAVVVALAVLGPWIAQSVVGFAQSAWSLVHEVSAP